DWGLAKKIGAVPCAEGGSGQWTGEGSALTNNDDGEKKGAPSTVPAVNLTMAGQALGTPAYMSPEQALGQWEQLGPATDIFGLGGILYAILTGQPPYFGDRQTILDNA